MPTSTTEDPYEIGDPSEPYSLGQLPPQAEEFVGTPQSNSNEDSYVTSPSPSPAYTSSKKRKHKSKQARRMLTIFVHFLLFFIV